MKLKPLKGYSSWTIEANRARYREEVAQGIYELMVRQRVNRTELAFLMGYESKSRVTHILSGEKNLQADTIADILLVLERTPHLVMADDFNEVRFAIDECAIRQDLNRWITTAESDNAQANQEEHEGQEDITTTRFTKYRAEEVEDFGRRFTVRRLVSPRTTHQAR